LGQKERRGERERDQGKGPCGTKKTGRRGLQLGLKNQLRWNTTKKKVVLSGGTPYTGGKKSFEDAGGGGGAKNEVGEKPRVCGRCHGGGGDVKTGGSRDVKKRGEGGGGACVVVELKNAKNTKGRGAQSV